MNNASEKNKQLVLQGFDTGTIFGAIFLILFSWDRRALGITALGEMRKEGRRRESRNYRRQFDSRVRPQEMTHPLGGAR